MIETRRLVLRPWRDADLVPFASLNADPEVMRYFPAPLTRGASDDLARRLRAAMQRNGFGFWAAGLRGGAGFIGFVGISRPSFEAPFTPCVEVGWRLARSFWGHGYATEAAHAALAHGFGTLGLAEIVAFTATVNLPSRRVMDRLGMTRDMAGDFDHPALPAGHPLQRHVLYRLAAPVPRPMSEA